MSINRAEFIDMYINYVLAEWDPHHDYLMRYGYGLWFKFNLTNVMNPKIIVELGVRAGYSLWAMLMGDPDAYYVGYDLWPEILEGGNGTDDNPGTDFSKRYREHAVKMAEMVGSHRVAFHNEDTQQSALIVPVADLYHVDAAHDFDGCFCDITKCFAVAERHAIVCVHDWNDEKIRAACRKAIKEYDLQHAIISNEWGDVLLSREPLPGWVDFLQERNPDWWEPHSLALAIQLTKLAKEELREELDGVRKAMEQYCEQQLNSKSMVQPLDHKPGQVVMVKLPPSQQPTMEMDIPKDTMELESVSTPPIETGSDPMQDNGTGATE